MMCPHCDYVDGMDWIPAERRYEHTCGEEGAFWKLPVPAKRPKPNLSIEQRSVYACPNCCKLFLLGAGV